jgi:predicted ATPase
MDQKLTKLYLKGFKSIAEVNLDFSDLNVLIGANGAGKSNLISFFYMLNHMLTGALQRFVAQYGPASALLHDGPKRTHEIEAEITVETAQGKNDYNFRLVYAANDTLIFADEKCRFSRRNTPQNPRWIDLAGC